MIYQRHKQNHKCHNVICKIFNAYSSNVKEITHFFFSMYLYYYFMDNLLVAFYFFLQLNYFSFNFCLVLFGFVQFFDDLLKNCLHSVPSPSL